MGNIHSATISNYLLEKIRVVQPAKGERNFHIFYQLVKAAPAKLRSQLGLVNDPKKVNIHEKLCLLLLSHSISLLCALDSINIFPDVSMSKQSMMEGNTQMLKKYVVLYGPT